MPMNAEAVGAKVTRARAKLQMAVKEVKASSKVPATAVARLVTSPQTAGLRRVDSRSQEKELHSTAIATVVGLGETKRRPARSRGGKVKVKGLVLLMWMEVVTLPMLMEQVPMMVQELEGCTYRQSR